MNKTPYAIIPSFIWFLIFLIVPVSIVLLFSLLEKGPYGQIQYGLNLLNYRRAFEPIYLKIFFRSLLLAFNTTLLCLLAAYPLAYYMARSSKRAKNYLLALVIIPFWTNFIIRIYALKLVLGENGILNKTLLALQIISSPLHLIDNQIGVYLGMFYNYLPFMILPLYVTLEKLDFSLLDAAYDLGANKLQMFIRVLIPLSSAGIVTGSLFVFIPAFGEFAIPDLLGGSQSMFVGNLITETFLKSRDWPFGSTLSSFLVVMTMVAFYLVHRKEVTHHA